MRKWIAVAGFMIGISAGSMAQKIAEANVPPAVTAKFTSTFTNTSNVGWEMDYDNYVAKFKNNKVDVEVTFNKDGNWLKTETPVTHLALPASVKACLMHQFNIFKENEIVKVDSPQGTSYSIDLEANALNYVVVVSNEGDLVSREEIKGYKKEE